MTTRPRRLSELDSDTPISQNHHVSAVSQVRFTDNSLERFRPQRGQKPQRLRVLSKNRDSPYMTQYKSTQGFSSMSNSLIKQYSSVALSRPRTSSNSERPEKMRKLISAPEVVPQHRDTFTRNEESVPKQKSSATRISSMSRESSKSAGSIRQIFHRLCPSLR